MNKILKIYLKKSKLNLSLIILGVLVVSLVNILPIKMLQKIVDDGFIAGSYRTIIIYSIILIILYLLRTVLSILVGISFAKLGQKIVSMIRRDLYNRVLMFPLDYFTKKESNYINTRLQEINNIKEFFSPNIVSGITSIIDFIFVAILLCNINYTLYLIVLIPVPAFFLMNKKIFKKFLELNDKSLEENAKYNAKVNETIRGIEEIKLSTNEDKEMDKIVEKEESLLNIQTKQMVSMKKNMEIISLFVSVLPILLYIIGGVFYFEDKISLGGVLSFSSSIGRVYAPFLLVSTIMFSLSSAIVSVKRIEKYFFNVNTSLLASGTKKIESIESINFKDVSFLYEKNRIILKDISFNLEKGKIYQIIGENGSGKTTLIKLILGVYEREGGTIKINNLNLDNIDKSEYLSRASVVSQKNFLYNMSIRENIEYGNENIDKEKYNELLNIFGFVERLNSLGINEDTIVGENGTLLSGGEIKKVCIMRALMKEADIYIFDESFNNLDVNAKNVLRNYMKTSLNKKIVLIIEHNENLTDLVDDVIKL